MLLHCPLNILDDNDRIVDDDPDGEHKREQRDRILVASEEDVVGWRRY
jgi:hypothetical protein